jgi:hypothetical protein
LSGLVLEGLVPVHFLLLESPFRKYRIRMRPHSDPRRDVYELEVAALRHPLLTLVRVVDFDLEVGVHALLPALLLALADPVPGRELGVGGHGRAGDVVGEESGVSDDVAEGDYVVLADDTTATG